MRVEKERVEKEYEKIGSASRDRENREGVQVEKECE